MRKKRLMHLAVFTTAIFAFSISGHFIMTELKAAEVTLEEIQSEFQMLMMYGNIKGAKKLLNKRVNGKKLNLNRVFSITELSTGENTTKTFLLSAVSSCQNKIVKFLIRKGAKVNVANLDGYTPLMEVCDVKTAKLLLRKGAKINRKSKNGETVLMNVLKRTYPSFKLVKFLIKKRANVNARDNSGKTVLQYAQEYKTQESDYFNDKQIAEYKEIIKALKNAGAK